MPSDRPSTSKGVRETKETFANANEQIRVTAEDYGFDQSVPFLCECSEATCMQCVRLSLTSYRKARAGKGNFIMIPGHHDPSVERVVARGEGYVLVASCA